MKASSRRNAVILLITSFIIICISIIIFTEIKNKYSRFNNSLSFLNNPPQIREIAVVCCWDSSIPISDILQDSGGLDSSLRACISKYVLIHGSADRDWEKGIWVTIVSTQGQRIKIDLILSKSNYEQPELKSFHMDGDLYFENSKLLEFIMPQLKRVLQQAHGVRLK